MTFSCKKLQKREGVSHDIQIKMKFFIHAGRIHTDGSLSKNMDPSGSATLYLCRAQINNIASRIRNLSDRTLEIFLKT
jgi:hypothetical protein